jgi:hypothetical protein
MMFILGEELVSSAPRPAKLEKYSRIVGCNLDRVGGSKDFMVPHGRPNTIDDDGWAKGVCKSINSECCRCTFRGRGPVD